MARAKPSSTEEQLLMAGAESERTLIVIYILGLARVTKDKAVREVLLRMAKTIDDGGHRHGV